MSKREIYGLPAVERGSWMAAGGACRPATPRGAAPNDYEFRVGQARHRPAVDKLSVAPARDEV